MAGRVYVVNGQGSTALVNATTERHYCTWSINNFSASAKVKIESSVFKAVGHNWKLVLEPDLGSTDFLTLMLQHMSEISVTVAICIDVVNKKGVSLGRHESAGGRCLLRALALSLLSLLSLLFLPWLISLYMLACLSTRLSR